MFNSLYYWLITPLAITQDSKVKYLRYILRYIGHWNTNQAWVKYLNSNPRIINWHAEYKVDFYLKFQNSYLSKSFNNQQKFLCLKNHYDWFFTHVDVASHKTTDFSLLSYIIEGEEEKNVDLSVYFKGIYHREGESNIVLKLDNVIQYILSFSYIILDGQPVLFIGGLQASKQDITNLETIKQLTKSLHGLRPKQLLLHGLSTLCSFYNIQKIVGVSNDNHFYQDSRKKKDKQRVKTNLDEFWLEFGATLDQWGNYVFTPLSNQIDLTEIPSKKRSQYRKRQLILDQLTEQSTILLNSLTPSKNM